MQFHKSPSGPDCAGYHKFYVWASSRRLQWGSDNTNPIEKFRLFGEKRERCWFGGGCSFRTFGLELHWIGGIIAPPRSIPQYENPDSSPFDIVPRSWEKLENPRGFISDGFLCGKFHHLFIFWPHWMRWKMRKAWAYLKEITNFHFIWCLANGPVWKISAENESAHNLIQSQGAERGDRALTIVKYVGNIPISLNWGGMWRVGT